MRGGREEADEFVLEYRLWLRAESVGVTGDESEVVDAEDSRECDTEGACSISEGWY